MENKHNFMGIIIPVIVAVILLTVIPILTNMSTDCSHNIGQLNINPDFSSGDYFVDKGSYDYIDSATIIKDENLIPENIKKDVTIFGITGTLESGGVPLEQFVEFNAPYQRNFPGNRLLTFLSRTPSWHTPVDIKIYYKNSSDEDVLLVSKRVDHGTINFIVIPRSYGNLKIVMSLVPDDDYGWDGFSGFYARTNTGVVTQLTAPSYADDFVLSYVDFDVFHVVYTAYGD
jgi:hypothetical protein